jgi:hypothetical protein
MILVELVSGRKVACASDRVMGAGAMIKQPRGMGMAFSQQYHDEEKGNGVSVPVSLCLGICFLISPSPSLPLPSSFSLTYPLLFPRVLLLCLSSRPMLHTKGPIRRRPS